ncbi:MAG: BMP family ABC transporter substrate-binding protein [Chloroflexi bacterium]|nr:MAG: BMP family ABC transporter substrate-binding protein [Chloroflexota bacterium]
MRKPRYGLGAGAVAASIILAACQGGGAGNSTSGSSSTPSTSAGPSNSLKIGLVTDVGTLDDKNFNQFSWEGAKKGAADIGAPAPKSVVTTASADYAKNIKSFVDQKFDIIVTVGFALGNDTTKAAKANPGIKFIGVDQGVCVTEQGEPDPSFGCKGDGAKLLPNYQGLVFKEAQPGYLAGIVAGSISKSGHIAAIGGTKVVPAVANYMAGYANGAAKVNPNVKVELQYVSDQPDAKAFNDPAGGKAFAEQLLAKNKDVDVLFQVAGKTGNGVLQAACNANIHAIGVDVDQHLSTPESAKCIVTSAEKKLTKAVSDAIKRVSEKTDKGGTVPLDITTDSIGLAPFYDFQNLITPEIQTRIDDAMKGLKDGSVDPCKPMKCS